MSATAVAPAESAAGDPSPKPAPFLKVYKKPICAVIGLVLGVIVALLPPGEGLTRGSMIVLGSVVTANVFWIFSVMPAFAVGLLMCAAWPLLKVVTFNEAFASFTTPGWWIVIGGLGIGAVVTKTGLMKRIALRVMSMFPASFRGQSLALILAGTVVAPAIPSTNAKGSIAAPLSRSISDTLGFARKSNASAGLFSAMFWGFVVTAPIFLSASSTNYVAKGLVPEERQGELSWISWFVAALPWAVIVLVGGYFALNFFFGPKDDKPRSKEFIHEQIADLGPMSKNEKITLVVLIATLIMWMLEQAVGISAALTAIVALCILIALGILTPREFRDKIPWESAVFIGTAMNLGTVLGAVGVSDWLKANLGDLIVPVMNNPYLMVVVLAVVIYAAKFVLVSLITAATVFMLVLVPFLSLIDVSPLVLVFVVLACINVWIMEYMNPPFLTTWSAVDGELSTRPQNAKASLIYMVINVIALLASVPYWQLLGLV